jgi:adenylate cyclase
MGAPTDKAAPVETRKLAAIMFTDMVGFSRQMGANEARMLRLLEVHNQLIQQAVAEYHGAVIKTVGDAFLVDFPSVVHAVQCAQSIQAQFRTHNAGKEIVEQIHVRIGIHSGDIVQKAGDVFGDGVNIASRLQDVAEPDTICISDVVYRDVTKKLELGAAVSLGRPKLKNITERFEVYALLPETPHGLRQTLRIQRLKLSRRVRPAHRMVVAGLVLVAATIVAVRYLTRPPLGPQSSSLITQEAPALPLPDKPSIVVLPFANMSNDPEQEYFSDGITEDLTSALSKLSGLFVISHNSAVTYKGKAVKGQEVSKELGVQYVLEGSVRKADGQVRITAQLIDATTDHHLWTARYDRPLQDIFALQDEITQKIVATLKLQLALWEQGDLVRKRTDNLEAYDSFLRGSAQFLHLTQETHAQARQMWEKALELDPQYAEAYQALGYTYLREWMFQWSPAPQNLDRAFELEQKALVLDPSLPFAHALLGWVYLWKDRHYEQAIAEAERAIALDPNNADSYMALAEILTYPGRSAEAIGWMEKAMRLNPRYPALYLRILGTAYYWTGRTEEAIAAFESALARNPNWLAAHLFLAFVYSEVGREAEARAEAGEVLRLSPNFSLEGVKQRIPLKDPAALERMLAALRQAGLK